MSFCGYQQVTPPLIGHINPSEALQMYASGYFPMGSARESKEYAWFTHVPRGIIPLSALYISKSLKKTLHRNIFEVRCDTAFEQVIDVCAVRRGAAWEEPRKKTSATWISRPIRQLFLDLHDLGYAHSVECWAEGKLVGGLYGLHIGGVFCGESMFSNVSNASKVALVHLVDHLNRRGFSLLDVQQKNSHTKTLGAIEVDENRYLEMLDVALTQEIEWGHFLPRHSSESGGLLPLTRLETTELPRQ